MTVWSVAAMKKITKRIPGALPPPPKSEIDGKIHDLSSKTIPELLEMRDRQQNLLKNKTFIFKLPDKGGKIQTFHDKIVNELKSKQEEEQTCKLFSSMKLSANQAFQDIEWQGEISRKQDSVLDSDDDSDPKDVLQILAQNTALEKTVHIHRPPQPLIKPEDLENIDENPHVKYLVDKTETNVKPKTTGLYKPFKTTMSDVHNPEKEILRKKHKHWEVTAATPPPIVHGPAKVLSLEESMRLQIEHDVHMKSIEAQHAAEKLFARTGVKMAELPRDASGFGKYREVDSDESEESDLEGSDKEVHDEEPEKGGVIFTVMK